VDLLRADLLGAEELWVARELLQRGAGLLFGLAFANVLGQWAPLLGDRGLTPVRRFTQRVPFRAAPSVFQMRYSDRLATTLALGGLAIAASTVAGWPQRLGTAATMLAFLTLWALYLSYVNVGQVWYGFGWEALLLELGFLAAFLGGHDTTVPWPTVLLLRWLLFRVELGAGLIKLRGDPCWRDLTCTEFHHETQPLPNRWSWWFHHLPMPAHRIEVAANHATQLVVPWLLFAPQPAAGLAGLAIVVTQAWLLLSGNFAWLNLATLVLAASALPDPWLAWLPLGPPATTPAGPSGWFLAAVLGVTAAQVALSWPAVRNLWSPGQRMNVSHNPLRLVGSYGAFGRVTRHRFELIVEGTMDAEAGADSRWEPYELRAKPGDPRRRPGQVAPYHLRLDWLLWFAAMSPAPLATNRWLATLVDRLLDGDPGVRRLLGRDPFEGRAPVAVRVRRYRYRFSSPEERRATGAWWVRQLVGEEPVRLRGASS
jgi:hypothetical protein